MGDKFYVSLTYDDSVTDTAPSTHGGNFEYAVQTFALTRDPRNMGDWDPSTGTWAMNPCNNHYTNANSDQMGMQMDGTGFGTLGGIAFHDAGPLWVWDSAVHDLVDTGLGETLRELFGNVSPDFSRTTHSDFEIRNTSLQSAVGTLLLPAKHVPELISYQGRLNDSVGDPLDGVPVDLSFAFYDGATAGDLLLTVEQPGLQVTQSIYNILIGSGTVRPGTEATLADLFRHHGDIWMGVEVDGDGEMTPRRRISSMGYALKAKTATDLSHVEPRDTAPSDPVEGDVYMNSVTHTLMVYDGSTWQSCW